MRACGQDDRNFKSTTLGALTPPRDYCKRAVETGGSMIFKRHVFFIAGFDPFDVPALHRRFRREAKTFEKTWNVRATVSELTGEPMEQWAVSASGPNWSTQVVYEQLSWHDIV